MPPIEEYEDEYGYDPEQDHAWRMQQQQQQHMQQQQGHGHWMGNQGEYMQQNNYPGQGYYQEHAQQGSVWATN
jgi:hypothetical protein